MNELQKIIYDLLFTKGDRFVFDITGLIDYIEDYPDIIESIVRNINKGKVEILRDSLEMEDDKFFWKVKIKRN